MITWVQCICEAFSEIEWMLYCLFCCYQIFYLINFLKKSRAWYWRHLWLASRDGIEPIFGLMIGQSHIIPPCHWLTESLGLFLLAAPGNWHQHHLSHPSLLQISTLWEKKTIQPEERWFSQYFITNVSKKGTFKDVE